MGFLSEYFMTYGNILVSYEEYVQEWYAIILLHLHSKLDVLRYAIEMVQKKFKFIITMRPVDTGVIHKPDPEFGF